MNKFIATIAVTATCIASAPTFVEASGCHRSRSYSSHSQHSHPSYYVQPPHVQPILVYPGMPYPGFAGQQYPGPSGPAYPGMPASPDMTAIPGPSGQLGIGGNPAGAGLPPGFVPGQTGPMGPGLSAGTPEAQFAPGAPFGQQAPVQGGAVVAPGGELPAAGSPVATGPQAASPMPQLPIGGEQPVESLASQPTLPQSPAGPQGLVEGPVVPTQFEAAAPVVAEINRHQVYMSLPLQLTAAGCGDVPGYGVLSFAGFEMPLTVNVWREGMIEVQMPTMNFGGATDATLFLHNADRSLLAELPLTLLNAAP